VSGVYLEGVELSSQKPLSDNLGAIDSTIIEGVQYISIARAEHAGCGPTFLMQCPNFPQCTVLQVIESAATVMEFFEHNNQTALLVDHTKNGMSFLFYSNRVNLRRVDSNNISKNGFAV